MIHELSYHHALDTRGSVAFKTQIKTQVERLEADVEICQEVALKLNQDLKHGSVATAQNEELLTSKLAFGPSSQYCPELLQKVVKLEAQNKGLNLQLERLEATHQSDSAQANPLAKSHAIKSAPVSVKMSAHVVMEVPTGFKICTTSGQAETLAEIRTRLASESTPANYDPQSGKALAEAVADMRACLAKDRRPHSEPIPEAIAPLTRGRRMRDLFYGPHANPQILKSTTSQRPCHQSWHSEPLSSQLHRPNHSINSESFGTELSLEEAKDSLLQSMQWDEFKAEMRERIERRDSDKSFVMIQGQKPVEGLAPAPVCSHQEPSLNLCQDSALSPQSSFLSLSSASTWTISGHSRSASRSTMTEDGYLSKWAKRIIAQHESRSSIHSDRT